MLTRRVLAGTLAPEDILTVVSRENETWIDPRTGIASLHLSCSLTTQPLLEHRLLFTTSLTFDNTYLVPHYGSNAVVAPSLMSLDLTVFSALQVDHGSFAQAEISVQPVSDSLVLWLPLFLVNKVPVQH